MAYDKEGNVYPIPKENLPIKLPEKIDLKQKEIHLIMKVSGEIKINGIDCLKETDTLDTFVIHHGIF